MKKSVLVVEDEKKILRFIRTNLLASDYKVYTAEDGETAVQVYEKHLPDIILLDVMLPVFDGFQVLKRIREFSDVPIIIITVKDSSAEITKGLELGADDYITKPFDINELLARIKAVLRRAGDAGLSANEPIIEIGRLTVNLPNYEVFVGDEPVRLTSTEFKLLSELVKNRGCVMTHEDLLTKVWGAEYKDETHYLRVCVAKIRQKTGIPEGEPGFIQTIPTIGYKTLVDFTS